MGLAGQQKRGEQGYAMAMLLVALGVMATLMSAAMPVWKQIAQREKEEELIFRGSQYARAIGLYQKKFAAANPPSLDVLLQQKFLRRKFRDPMVPDGEFQLLYQANQAPGQQGQQGQQGRGGAGQISVPTTAATGGGIIGVMSKSTAQSIRMYNGRTHYNEWQFVPVQQTQQPTQPGGQRGLQPQPGVQPGVQQPGRGGQAP
jgi:type II secretory pathway pseudopilin PulG